MRKIPYVPFLHTHDQLRSEILLAFENFYDRKHYILGDEVKTFEKAWAGYIGTRFAIGTGNGHDALLIALKAAGIGPGDEVILPANTFLATALAVHNAGARPVLADPGPDRFNLAAADFENHITRRTRVLIPVHLYGIPCDMDDILSLAGQYKLTVIEDNAQAQGARYHGKKAGAFGLASITSFYPTKNLGALGDGGMINTNSEMIDKMARKLRNYGSDQRGKYDIPGYNSRLDELQAAILNVKLKYLDEQNEQRRKIAELYAKKLQGNDFLKIPQSPPDSLPVYHVFPLFTKQRDALQTFLTKAGIGTLAHYPIPIHLQKAFRHLGYKKGDFPRAEQLSETTLSLPLYPGLSDEDVSYICETVSSFFK